MKLLRYNAPASARLRFDGPDGPEVAGGETFEVSDERALELLTAPDYSCSEVAGSLSALSRSELDVLAAEAGLAPSDFPNKAAVIAALENDKPEAEGAGLDSEEN